MAEPLAADALCDHNWQYNKPAHASASIRICATCHKIDGEDLMRTLNEYVDKQVGGIKPQPTSLLYAWSDGTTFSNVDRDGGIPDPDRERAILRGVLTHALRLLDEADLPLRALQQNGSGVLPCNT